MLRTTMLIDWAAAIVATLVGIMAASLAADMLDWKPVMISWAAVYSLIMLTTANGTSNGILRVYDRFDAIGVQFTITPALRFITVAAAWALDASMPVFIIAWGAAFAIGQFYMFVRGQVELRAHMSDRLWSGFKWGDLKERGSDFWKFIRVVYWQTNIDLLPKHVAVLLAGALLGPAAAGMFRLAREFSTVLTQPAIALREVLFPDLTRSFHAEDGGIHSVPFKAAVIAGMAGLGFVLISIVFGESILGIIGEEYIPAASLLTMLLIAASFDLASAPLRAAAYAIGRAGSVLNIHVIGTIVYVSMFFLMTPLTGLTGPGWAAMLASLLAFGLTARLVARASGSMLR